MGAVQWDPSARATNPEVCLTTELNSLGAAGGTHTTSVTISNDAASERDPHLTLELDYDFATAPVVKEMIDCYLVAAIGTSTTFPANTGAAYNPMYIVGSFVTATTDTTGHLNFLYLHDVPLANLQFWLKNNTADALAASGNTLDGYFYRETVA